MTEPTVDQGGHLLALIRARQAIHERSQQTRIGASEIGTPCDRKLALKLVEAPTVPAQAEDDKWRATVGVATHEWLADMMRAENERYSGEANAIGCGEHDWCGDMHRDRYVIEHRTAVGTIAGDEVPGNLDVFDRLTKTLTDWKIVGPTSLKKYKSAKHPGQQYEVQGQLYARGLVHDGEDVEWTGCMILPSNGELKMAFYWETEYDPKVGKEAFKRARALWDQVKDADDSVFRKLDTAEDHCSHCPFFSPGSTDPLECPGDAALFDAAQDVFGDLLPPDTPFV